MLFSHYDASANISDGVLTLKCAGLERRIDFSAGIPRTLEIRFDDCLLAGLNAEFDIAVPGLPILTEAPAADEVPEIRSVRAVPAPAYDGKAFYIEIDTFEDARQLKRLYRYVLRPGLAAIGVEMELCSEVTPLIYTAPRHADAFNRRRGFDPVAVLDRFTPVTSPATVRAVEFRMRTDYTNDVLREQRDRADGCYCGNILEAGALGWIQEAPPSEERYDRESYDFLYTGSEFASCGIGFIASDIVPNRRLNSWRHVLLATNTVFETAVRNYWTARGVGSRSSGRTITVNPWGSGDFYNRVNQDFLLDEIRDTAECGADVYQIDDGWQAGGVLSDIAVRNHWVNRNFWHPDPVKLPDGFASLADAAKRAGIALSLWFAPSSNRAFVDWEESAEVLLDFWRKYNICTFKLDGIIFTGNTSENNFRNLLRRLHTASNGAISVNLDVTNGLRGGVCEFGEFGSVFLENRYLNKPRAALPYDPEATLENLWRLSRWIPAGNLQIEAPSPEEINPASYDVPGRPLRPDRYSWEFMLAITLFAQPLLWFMPSRQTPELRRRTRKIMELHRKFRDVIHRGDTMPVGDAPGRGKLTGFLNSNGLAIAYRTFGANAECTMFPHHQHSELLYSNGENKLWTDGTAVIAEPGSFALWKLDGIQTPGIVDS